MVKENALGEFLRARRAQVRPADLGLPAGGSRRVAGLRREEVALLAGVSTDYYVRLEQGRERNPSAQFVDALARGLVLDDDAVAHLHRLARPEPVRRMWQAHSSGKVDEQYRLWGVLMFQSWLEAAGGEQAGEQQLAVAEVS